MTKVSIDQIKVNGNRRALRNVASLTQSIKELGLLNPITLREDFVLVAGYHRLTACQQLGWVDIEANVISLDDLHAQLAEIDENLVRNELNVLEHSQEMKRRKEIYEALHPETKQGASGRRGSGDGEQISKSETISFSEDTALKLGASKRTVEQDVQIADSIPEDVQELISDTPLADNKTDLLALARMPEQEQRETAQRIVDGDAASIKDLRATQRVHESDATWLIERMETGAIKPRAAVAILAALDACSEEVRRAVAKWNGIAEPGIVNILERLLNDQAETWDELLATDGFIQPGEAEEAKHIALITVKEFERYLEAKFKEHKAQAFEVKRQHEIQNAVALAEIKQKYNLLYVDPPWRYEFTPAEDRAIENHYPTMELEEIKQLPVNDIADDSAILFMWTTSPKLADAIEVISAWGFTYRTCAVWVKDRIGTGHYFRQRHELLLLAIRGDMRAPGVANRPDSVIESPRGKHSAKPDKVYDLIEKMYPEYRKIELFSRNIREGWHGWGNQYGDVRLSDAA